MTKLHHFLITPRSYYYICTRLTIRKKRLIQADQYMRLLHMDLYQITRFIGETEYQSEVNELAGTLSGIALIEAALTQNLAKTYHNILSIVPVTLHEIAARYLGRYDILNVMLLLRSKQFGIPADQIRQVIIPAGGLSPEMIDSLLKQTTMCEIAERLAGWEFHNVIVDLCSAGYRSGLFAEVENALFISYYSGLYQDIRAGIPGVHAILPYLRFEIDVINIRNLFRLRAGSRTKNIKPFIIPGGNLNPEFFQRVYFIEDRELFIPEMQKTKLLNLLMIAFHDKRGDPSFTETNAAEFIWQWWSERKTPLFTIVMAVNQVRLHRLDQLSRRNPFSVLPILSYLEHKRYEVMNLRAIARGKQFGLNPDHIRQYLVL